MANDLVYFMVEGSGNFPFDCLRAAQAWPATSEDVERLVLACPTQAPPQRIMFATHKAREGIYPNLWREKKWPVQWVD